jgi:RHS repeat-associated protein
LRYRLGEQLETDNQANIVWYQELSPFGSVTFQTSKTEASRVYRFAGYRWDSESGLYHCGARYYASWIGRWISADPLGTVDGLNLYVYVGNDPVNFDDPGGTMMRSTAGKSSSLRRTRSDTNFTSSSGFRRSTMNFSTVREANGALQGNGGFQAGTFTNGLGRIIRPSPSSVFVPSPSLNYYFRVMDAARGHAIENGSHQTIVDSLVTRSTGDFNFDKFTTTYFANSERAAFSHTRWMTGPITLMRIGVPFEHLMGANIYKLNSKEDFNDRFYWVSTLITCNLTVTTPPPQPPL